MVLLSEDDVKTLFKEHMLKEKIEFRTEANFGNCMIDFLVKFDDLWVGVEVKGETNKMFTTFGQLANYYSFMSHICLCAPSLFIKKFEEMYSKSPIFTKIKEMIGLITVDGNDVEILKRPSNVEYYIKHPETSIKENKHYRGPRDDAELDEIDKKILNSLETRKISTLWDIIQSQGFDSIYKKPYETINKRINNLIHFGHVQIINKYPKTVALVEK